MEEIRSGIENSRKDFILHNIVRLREMIRYLPPVRLDLFKEIPFLIHVNSPEFPAHVKSTGSIFGVWNFENSGFAKNLAATNQRAAKLLQHPVDDPAVQAIYHIGSLGTFTQSAKSDFDFWIIIDKTRFDSERLKALHEKLNLIIVYSRKHYSQEVSFFIHDAGDLKNNQFNEDADDEVITVPKMLIKEEFYRTFIMVAGKIPVWAVLPPGLDAEQSKIWIEHALDNSEFIDLGILTHLPIEEIQRGLLWQICKAPYDPVKSIIKATVTASYLRKSADGKTDSTLLCDRVKERFAKSIIDDYAADPYILAFERVLDFYEALKDPGATAQIKAAIFFRLCGFPLVSLPPEDSPKRKILNSYIQKWALSGKRLTKLLAYQNWSESEKNLFDRTMINRISLLYRMSLQSNGGKKQSSDGTKESILSSTAQDALDLDPDFHILKNKAHKIIIQKKNTLPSCSIYLRIKPHTNIILLSRKKEPVSKENSMESKKKPVEFEAKTMEWLLLSQKDISGSKIDTSTVSANAANRACDGSTGNPTQTKTKTTLLYTSRHFTQALGWSMSNHLYVRGTTRMKIQSQLKLSTSLNKQTDTDEIYLYLQPWMPMSDAPFASEPWWEKIVVIMLMHIQADSTPVPECAEFLLRNSWGEIFFEVLDLGYIDDMDEKCYQTAMKILEFHGEDPEKSSYSIFQLAHKAHPELIRNIKTVVEETKVFNKNDDITIGRRNRRPYLDRI